MVTMKSGGQFVENEFGWSNCKELSIYEVTMKSGGQFEEN